VRYYFPANIIVDRIDEGEPIKTIIANPTLKDVPQTFSFAPAKNVPL
jgi:hypothetical protein